MNHDKILEIATKAGFHSTKLLQMYGGKFDALCDSELKEIDSIFEFAKLILEERKLDDDWISNVGRDRWGHPETLTSKTKIEVRFADGQKDTGYADTWHSFWKDDGDEGDIIAYRILKD